MGYHSIFMGNYCKLNISIHWLQKLTASYMCIEPDNGFRSTRNFKDNILKTFMRGYIVVHVVDNLVITT